MGYRAVITDLDGTLLNSNHQISSFTAETLRLLRQQSIPVIFATGRPYPDVFHTIDSCNLDGSYIITSNGARMHNPERAVVASYDIDPTIVAELVQLRATSDADPTHILPISTNMYRHDEWVTNHGVERMLKAYADSGFHYKLEDLSTYPHDGVHEVFFVGQPEDLKFMEKILEARFAGKVEFSFSLPYILDAVAPEVHKGNAMREVAGMLGVDVKDVVAFGDGMNDLRMLQKAGKGYVMRNANPQLKERLPELEVIGSNDEDAVAKKIRELFEL